MKYKTLDSYDFSGKLVLLRSDLNSEIVKGKPVDSPRISESAKTIKELKKKGARVVVIAHQAKPGEEDFISLKEHAKILSKYTKIKFVPDIFGEKALSSIKELKKGEAILLENIRYEKDEFRPSTNNKIITRLGMMFDYYVNDAFSVMHRNHTSIMSFPKIMKSCLGRLAEREVMSLEKIKIKDCLFILGGAKPNANILLMDKKNVITCGIFGQLCLIASGKKLGAQEKFLKKKLKYLPEIKKHVKNVKTPVDLAVRCKGKRKDISLEEFPSKYEIFDIGPETQKIYIEMIKKAKVI
jgi:phosphoglycerate kinase